MSAGYVNKILAVIICGCSVWLKKPFIAGLKWIEIKLTLVYLKWRNTILLQLLGDFSAHPRVSTSAPPLWQSDLSLHFLSCLITALCCSLWAVCQFKPTAATDWFKKHSSLILRSVHAESSIKFNPKKTSVMFSGAHLGIRATPQLSPTLMNYTCLASHLPRSVLCNVSHAWRSVWVYVCLCGCIYIQTGIEGTVTHSLCSLFLPHNLPTHPSPISKKKKKRKSISLDISQLYNVVLISPHRLHPELKTFFHRMMLKINIIMLINLL